MTSESLREAPGPHRVSPSPVAIGAALSISAASAETGISVATLRVWQARYGLGPGLTTPGGHRRYTPGDIQRLRRVKHLVSEGLTTSEAVHAVLVAARSELGLAPDADPAAHHLGAAALELDGPTVRRLIDEHLRRGDVAGTWETVIRPVLRAIGDRWSRLSHGIAVEHLLTHIAIDLLSNHGEYFSPGGVASVHTATVDARCVVLACVPGEEHDLPLVVLDAALHSFGIHVTRLPAPTPATLLDEAVARYPRPVIALLAINPEPVDPAVLEGYPAGATLLAMGPGWRPEDLPACVAHIESLAAAHERITALVASHAEIAS